MLFRFKNGDLFKPKGHVPVISWLKDLNNYIGSRFEQVNVILDCRHMSEADFVWIYTMINNVARNHNDARSGGYINRVDADGSNGDHIVTLEGCIGDMYFTIWINHMCGDFYATLWRMVYNPLFSNIPRHVWIKENDRSMLSLANYTGNIIAKDVDSNDPRVSIDVIRNKVTTNLKDRELLIMGDKRIGNFSIMVYGYYLHNAGDWVLQTPNNEPNESTIYTCSTDTSGVCWDRYIGVKL